MPTNLQKNALLLAICFGAGFALLHASGLPKALDVSVAGSIWSLATIEPAITLVIVLFLGVLFFADHKIGGFG